MCDTFYFKNENNKFFMKNSDRSPNEPNLIKFIPHKIHKENILKATYIEIPQVKETYACVLVSPSWLWGAEMGYNEFGVSIGNEAVFTKNNDKKIERLIGMDYLRLGLERGKSALESAHIIIDLLKEYGQGGNCGYDHEFYYDNSYLIMDKNETYILETVGKDYALLKCNSSYNISNKLSINNEYIESSKNYRDFEKDNSDFLFTLFSMSKNRECDGKKLLTNLKPDMFTAIEVLSHHRKDIKHGDVGSICMHKNLIGDHTTGSMIVDYNYDNPTIWLTGSPSPCISIFKPYYFGTKSNQVKENETDQLKYYYDRMYLNRLVLGGVINYTEFKNKVNTINSNFILKERELRDKNASIEEFIKFQNDCNKIEQEFIESYRDLIDKCSRGEVKLKGIWNKLNKSISSNPLSSSLKERLS